MQKLPLVLAIALAAASLSFSPKDGTAGASSPAQESPLFSSDGKLLFPDDYRRWIFLSSGFGMSYSQQANGAQMFTNVFVKPSAYNYFLANGKWPDKTVFVLEEYGSTSQGSINKHGSYQTELMGYDAEVKDEARFRDKWAYFNFEPGQQSAGSITPSKNDCWKCHEQNAALEHSFVQFYPVLLGVAKEKGTLKPGVQVR